MAVYLPKLVGWLNFAVKLAGGAGGRNGQFTRNTAESKIPRSPNRLARLLHQ